MATPAQQIAKFAPRPPGSWVMRRRMMWAVTLFCMASIAWVLYKDMTSGPADTAVTMSYVTLISIVGSYVFGAAFDDSKARDHAIARARIGLKEDDENEDVRKMP